MKFRISLVVLLLMSSCVIDSKKKEAEGIIRKVENFKEINDRYPYNFEEINIIEKEEGPFYYELSDDSLNYIIWYGLGLGDSEVYSSKQNNWISPDVKPE